MSARLNDTEWLRRQLGLDGPSGNNGTVAGEADGTVSAPTDIDAPKAPMLGLDGSGDLTLDGTKTGRRRRPIGSGRKSLIRFGGLAAAAVVISLLGSTLLYAGDKPRGQRGNDSPAAQVAMETTAAPTPVASESVGIDRPLPFTASANCPAGSTSAQTLAGADPTNAFVCVRKLVDGQIVQIDLSKSYVLTAISLTPGWVGKDSSGSSQWAQHRVVTRVQYIFNDTDRTIIVQDTGNVHGEAVRPVKHVLASKITMLILQTSRPPAETTSPAPEPGGGLAGGGLFGDPDTTSPSSPSLPLAPLGPGGQTTTDPVDATFAISRLKVIGHEAI